MAGRTAILRLVKGTSPLRELELEPGEVVDFGRGEAADVQIEDSRLSRVHFRLVLGEDMRCRVLDLKSRNGVLINGRRVEDAWLTPGDRLCAGRQIYEFNVLEEPEDIDLEEDTEVIAKLLFCEHCGASVGPIAVAEGRAKERDECFLCEDCSLLLEVGSPTFLHYELGVKLGAGTAGLVYRATDRRDGKVVALKVLKPGPKVKQRQILRFLREATTISSLEHEHIVKVYEAEEFGRGYYLALEYFEGENLKDLLEREGTMPPAEAALIGEQIASAIGHAAERGVVHRDVKPANILYDRRRRVAKLSDFGLARGPKTSRRRLTREGEGLGTPTYMPPEQMRNAREADHRADIYSLGATLFHLLTGRLPILAATYQEFVSELQGRDPPLASALRPEVPVALAEIVRRCLQKDPNARYSQASELARALAGIRSQGA